MTRPAPTSTALDALLDKQAITEVLHQFCRGADRRDWELVRGCYHPDATDDHALYTGPRDGFITWLTEFMTGCIATQHTVSNALIRLDGDNAGCESYVRAWHLLKPDHDGAPPTELVAGARYVDDLHRRDGEWRIASRTVVIDWATTTVIAEPADLGPRATRGRAGPDDVSYRALPQII
jgi:hypothetical protein